MEIKTEIKETLNGHTVEFTIGVQTFSLAEIEAREYEGSLKMAQWYEKQLLHALSNLSEVAPKEEKEEKNFKELEAAVLNHKAKSKYKQATIIILRDIFNPPLSV